jgi:uncharacterized protein (TIGR03790 family)
MLARVFLRRSLLLLVALGLGVGVFAAEKPRVLILANSEDRGSLEVARHYAQRRGLDRDTIVALPMPLTEQITWREFIDTIWNPLLAEAIKREAVDAIAMNLTDETGRTKIVSSGHRLDALVVCRGVPLRVAHDAALFDERTNPLAASQQLRSNEGAVDSELALLAVNCPPIAAFVPNPVFLAHAAGVTNAPGTEVPALRMIIPVGRLDGPTVDDAKALVDRALAGERSGLAGRAYLDIGGPHPQGDEWLEGCIPELAKLGFETDADRDRATLPAHARFDAPALYFGWYTGHLNGPFSAPEFRFPPGAIALHIHSFSAETLRSTTRGWAGPMVAKGVTATFGNVAEPYLQFTHQPHVVLRGLLRGEPIGVAALGAVNCLSWKAILIGDPLYRPFARTLDEQWAGREELSAEAQTYVRLRRMRLLVLEGRGAEALELGVEGMWRAPSLPLALSVASLQLGVGQAEAARRTLGVFAGLKRWRPADLPLVLAAARTLRAAEGAAEGVALIERLLEGDRLAKDVRVAVLLEGADLARAALDFTRSGRWDAERERLLAPPPDAGGTR